MTYFISLFKVVKPGILFSNGLTFVMGFFVAYKSYGGDFSLSLFIYSLFGVLLTIASSTAINNFIDQDIDKVMKRTANRVSVSQILKPTHIVIYSSILLILGFCILIFLVNIKAAIIVGIGFFVYIVLYTCYLKRKSTFSTLVGSISGGCVSMAGYVSNCNTIDLGAWLVFAILFVWQMPHFFAIGIYRLNDYKMANIPILPVADSIEKTKVHIVAWILVLIPIVICIYLFNYGDKIYLVSSLFISICWIYITLKGFNSTEPTLWAKKVFLFSILVICVFSASLILDSILTNIKV